MDLRDPNCCVVSIQGIERHLEVLQSQWGDVPSDVDLRARITVGSATEDCLRVRRSVSRLPEYDDDKEKEKETNVDPITLALRELACGMAVLTMATDKPAVARDDVAVLVRIVCASGYEARDPVFHTDKASVRGYVTLHGPGTDFMTRPVSPWEYLSLRGFGRLRLGGHEDKDMRRADNLEFIIMKGDHYHFQNDSKLSGLSLLPGPDRTHACVHRSPPATNGGRRVIVSFDLADGSDDREWYESGKKRPWRSGMTQRKSHLVA